MCIRDSIIEAVKWHAFGARILILNNVLPSTVFWERTFARLCASGTTVLHLMNRCVAPFARADRCVLLSPSGRIARTIYADSFDPAWINRYIGRRATRKGWPAPPVQPGEEILRADDVRVEGDVYKRQALRRDRHAGSARAGSVEDL